MTAALRRITLPLLFLAAAAAPPAPAPAPVLPVTAEALVGRWGDNGDCTHFLILRGDGTFRSWTGGEGRWSFRRGELVMTGANASVTRRVARIDRARIRLSGADGSAGISQRCPSP